MISKVVSFLTKQLKQKKKLLLKSLFILLLGFSFLPQQNYFSFNEVYAADDSNQETVQQKQKEKLASIDVFLQAISDVAFALLWPLVALAGLAMDNSLIYGSFMGLDVTLWNIRQIVRSFANYTLGFLLLAGILWYNLSGKDSINGMKLSDLLKNVLIASVLIQASWFIMMVLVDLSTIMTYGIGGLPYSVFDNASLGSGDNSKMFKMVVDLDLGDYEVKASNQGDVSDAIKYYWHVTGSRYVSPCETATVKFTDTESQSFIIGRKYAQLGAGKEAIPGYCMYYGALISFNDFYDKTDKAASGEDYGATLKAYRDIVKDDTKNEYLSQLVANGIIFPLSDGKIDYVAEGKATKGKVKVNSNPERNFGTDFGCSGKVGVVSSKKKPKEEGDDWECLYSKAEGAPELTLSNLMNKVNSMTGPFAALYSSMVVYSNLNMTGKGLWQKFVISLVNTCIAGMLILPLIALVIVLFVRIGLLWIVIAISPFLVLVYLFDKIIPMPSSLKEHLGFMNLINLLLAPVLISFAVGVSLIFMTVLKDSVGIGTTNKNAYLQDPQKTEQFYENFNRIAGVEMSGSDLDIFGFIKVKLDTTMINISWVLTMFFGIGISWFLLFWAIKQTSIGQKVGSKIQGLGETFLSTTPIIPVGKYGLSWNGLQNAPDQVFNQLTSDMKSKDRARLDSLLNIGKTDFEKGSKTFIEQSSTSFNDAFKIKESHYKDTDAMIGRLDAVYENKDFDWKGRGSEISKVYSGMIEHAESKESLDKIVEHLNKNAKDKAVELTKTELEIKGTKYKVTKKDGNYVLEGGDKTEDGK